MKSGRSRSIRSWRSRPSRESQMSGPNQPSAAATGISSGELPPTARIEHDPRADRRQRGLEADEALHAEPAGPAGEVEPVVEHLALAGAQARGDARAEHGREPQHEPAHDRRALVLRRAGARDEPVERPAVAQHRDAGDPDADGGHREHPGEHRRDRHTSTFVVRRMSTKAAAHRPALTVSAAMPANDVVISRITPGEIRFISTIPARPMPATT